MTKHIIVRIAFALVLLTAASALAQSDAQNQISLLAPSVVAWNLPQSPASLVSSVFTSPLLTMAAPLYAWNCSLLL